MSKNQDYLDLVNFWNQAFAFTEEDKKQLFESINPEEDHKGLAPSQKQFDALKVFINKENVLDYGAGSGWASIIMAKMGTKKVVAVDVAEQSIELLKVYAQAFKVDKQIEAIHIDENWLEKQKEATYDGFFSSNVIDVVPLDMAKDIIKNVAKVVKKDAPVLFSLNYYINPKDMESRGAIVKGNSVYLNGVLRLTSLTDQQWLDIFNEYFELANLSYYAWENEPKETRRLFLLKKK